MLHYSGEQYAIDTNTLVYTTLDPNFQHSMKSGHRANSFYDFLIVNQYYNCLGNESIWYNSLQNSF